MKSTNTSGTAPKSSSDLPVFSDPASSANDALLELTALGLTPQSDPPPGFDPQDVVPRHAGDEPQPLLSVALDVSGRCNLACQYCAEAASQPERPPMAAEVVDAALRLLERSPHPGIRPSVRIGSGEPLLALPLLRHLHDKLTEGSTPIDVSITTNGTQIDDEVADWLASTNWRVKISLDGPRAVHDTWRPQRGGQPSYERVVQAVRRMLDRCPERVSVAAVLCRGTNPGEVFESIAELGVRRIELLPVAHRPKMHEQDMQPTVDDVEAYREFINDYARGIVANGAEAVPSLVRFEETVRYVMGYGNPAVPCGAGRGFFGVGADGTLYPCFRFVGLEKYRLGDVHGGLNVDAAAAFGKDAGRATNRRPRCPTCRAASLCGGPCFSVAEFFGPGDGAPVELHCAYKLADARAAFWLVNHLRELDPERLLAFLSVAIEVP